MRAGLVNYLLAYSALVECGVRSEASLLGGQRLVLTHNTTATLWSGGGTDGEKEEKRKGGRESEGTVWPGCYGNGTLEH